MPLWHIFWLASTSIPDNCQRSRNFRHKSEVPQVYPVPSVIQISSDVFGEAIHWGHAVLARCGWHVTIDPHSWSFLQYVWFKGHAQKMLEAFWPKDSHQNLTWPSEKKHERHALLQQRSCTFAIASPKLCPFINTWVSSQWNCMKPITEGAACNRFWFFLEFQCPELQRFSLFLLRIYDSRYIVSVQESKLCSIRIRTSRSFML